MSKEEIKIGDTYISRLDKFFQMFILAKDYNGIIGVLEENCE